MREHVQQNINKLNSQVNECRVNGKYCDIDFRVEGNVFKCHRLILGAASDYFDAMFCGNFKEKTATEIDLPEIEASVFQKVLEYIYTGDVTVTGTNLFSLVRASVFYKLDGLEDLCVQQIEKNVGPPIENIFDILSFARTFAKTKLLDISSKYVRKHLDYFSKLNKFLEISFEDLSTILLVSLPSQNQSVLMNALVRWTQRGTSRPSEERKQHFNEIVEKFNFAKISPEYTKYLVKALINNGESVEDGEDERSANEQSLHLYVRSSHNKETVTNVFTFHEYMSEYSGELSCEADITFDFLRSIALDNRLYSLGYSGKLSMAEFRKTVVTPERILRYSQALRQARQIASPVERQEALNRAQDVATHRVQQLVTQLAEISQNAGAKRQKMSETPVQTFSTSSSASLFVNAYLTPPPLFLNRFEICGTGESIYVYDRNVGSNIIRNGNNSLFDDEELARGVYLYNRARDEWLPIPPLKQKKPYACMTCDDRMVYVIGGSDSARQVLQALDIRTREWQVLASTSGSYELATSCMHKGKVQVSMIFNGCCFSETYDPVAGKWDNFVSSPDPNAYGCGQQLFSYKDNLVTVFEDRNNAMVRVSEFKERKWFPLASVSNTINKIETLRDSKHSLVDAVIFKPYGL